MKEKIIIVDDEPDVLKTLSIILREEEYTVRTASGGEQAIQLFQSEPYDLIITDMRMPGMDGLELMRRIKDIDDDIEVIILTGYASVGNAIEAMRENGAFDYLTKPLEDTDLLVTAVERALERRQLRTKNRNLLKALMTKQTELEETNITLKAEIEERKTADKALKQSEEKYRSILESIEEGYYEVDIAGNSTFVNDSLCTILGYPRDEIIGMNNRKYMDEENAKRVYQDFNSVYKTGNPTRIRDWEIIRKNATKRHVETSVSLMKDKEGNPTGFRGIVRDITEKKNLEAQLIQAQKMEAIGTLAGGIAHDFNNLLMAIQGRTSLMLTDKDASHPDFEHLKGTEDYVKSAADLTKQLLGFARGGKYEVKPTDLNDLVKESSEMFGRTKKEIAIHTRFQKDIWTVEVDHGQINQVLVNLYLNAWQAMPGGGDLFIHTDNVTLNNDYVQPFGLKEGRYVKISVTDMGVGMDEETMQRIFDPFFTTREMGKGTGLGLASAYGIIKNHGGFINFFSEKGKGSTFTIYLPASKQEVVKEKTLPEEILKGTETVLLVDDEEMILDVSQHLLITLGYKVVMAHSGKEAIEIYEKSKEKIDIVLLDMIMPGMGGCETYEKLKEINPDIKALLSSGYSINGQAKEILNRGCDGFIQKPFTMKELSKAMREVLEKS